MSFRLISMFIGIFSLLMVQLAFASESSESGRETQATIEASQADPLYSCTVYYEGTEHVMGYGATVQEAYEQAMDGCCVMLGKGKGPNPIHNCRVTYPAAFGICTKYLHICRPYSK